MFNGWSYFKVNGEAIGDGKVATLMCGASGWEFNGAPLATLTCTAGK